MKKKKGTTKVTPEQEQKCKDPFLIRREMQSALIKKMLAKCDQPVKSEEALNPQEKINYFRLEQEENI
jgi:hypothetical protein